MKKKHVLWIISIFLMWAADRAVKAVMISLAGSVSFPFGHRFFEIPGFFVVTYQENYGSALGILPGGRWFFVVITTVALAAASFYAFSGRLRHVTGEIAYVLLAGGALGNYFDRLTDGYVVDMFQFIFADHFLINFIFNVADIFVTAGGVFFCVYFLFFHVKKRPVPEPEGGPDMESAPGEEKTDDNDDS